MKKTKQISKFWTTLDALIGAGASRHHWTRGLGDELKYVEPFLKPAGNLAMSIDCPSPGGEGCPRQVVCHADGTIRAICGERPKMCADLELVKEDINILELDRRKLTAALAAALSLTPPTKTPPLAPVMRIGAHDIFAGSGIPVFLTIPGARPDLRRADLSELLALAPPVLVLVPGTASLTEEMAGLLDQNGVTTLALDDLVNATAPGKLALTTQGTTQMDRLVQQLADASAKSTGPKRAWNLPPDARWEEITIRFISEEVINASFRGSTRRFEPDGLGMKNAKNGKPKAAWTYLRAFAIVGGSLPIHPANGRETSKHQKQKQGLSKALRDSFGVSGDPFNTDGNDYVTRFVLSADGLMQGKQGQRQRNFAATM